MATNKNVELAEALRNALQNKPLSKITIQEIAQACSINRQTFYYHFKDVYYLTEFLFKNDVNILIEKTREFSTEEKIQVFYKYILDNKNVILNTINSIDPDLLNTNLYSEVKYVLISAIKSREKVLNIELDEDKVELIAEICKYPIVGKCLEWFKSGMTSLPDFSIDDFYTKVLPVFDQMIIGYAKK